LVVLLLLIGCAPQSDRVADAQTPQPRADSQVSMLPRATLPDGTGLTLELALTLEEIAQGLMFRPSLPDDRGMLFLFEIERKPSFWMKNTIIPLDLVFLDGSGRIVDIIADAQPCAAEPCPQYIPDHPARAVLEIAAGNAARHGLAAGDLLVFERVEGYPVQPAEERETD
jgi:uncharacterized membrane protein (UPF0127 family)